MQTQAGTSHALFFDHELPKPLNGFALPVRFHLGEEQR
jgi:hypothetical protein